jgi:hypothetical protein
VLSGKQRSDFGVLRFPLQYFHFAGKIRQDIFTFGRKLGKRFQILDILCQLRIRLDILFQPAPLLQDCLRFLLIVPEIRSGYVFFELENLGTFMIRIKDNLESDVFFLRLRSLSPEVLRASNPP